MAKIKKIEIAKEMEEIAMAEGVEGAAVAEGTEETGEVSECFPQCHLCFETDCEGEVKVRGLLGGDLTIPICKKHYEEHQIIIYLHNNGYDIEKILAESEDWRKKEALTIQFSIPEAGNIEDVVG